MTDEVRATGTGHLPRVDDPTWVLVHEPTAAQVADAVKVAGHKLHRGMGVHVSEYRTADFGGEGWHWWLLLDKPVAWVSRYTPNYHADEFNPDEGRQARDGKEEHTRPGKWERLFMKAQGEDALHRFIDGLDATNAERAAYIQSIGGVIDAVHYGDLPAAIRIALTTGLPDYERTRLVGMLDGQMIYWPDYQRAGSTSADRTIPHHVPAASPSNSGTSLTISGSGTISGTSLTVSGA